MQDPGELDRNIATSDNQYALGLLLEGKHLVRGNRQISTLDLGPDRGRSRGKENVFGRILFAVQRHGMRIDQRGMTLQNFHASGIQQRLVDSVEPCNLLILVGNQGWPGELAGAHRPAIACGILKIFGIMRSIDQKFFGNTADIDTGTSQTLLFGHRDASPVACGHPAGTNPTGSRPNRK